jgi:hypothetical protein
MLVSMLKRLKHLAAVVVPPVAVLAVVPVILILVGVFVALLRD